MKTISLVTSCTFLCALLFAIPTHASIKNLALSGPEMVSSESSNKMNLVDAANYCRTLNSVCELRADGTPCNGDSFKGWRLPSADELGWFLGLSKSEDYLWTRTQYTELDKYIILSLVDGSWGWAGYAADVNVRCVK
ncbi:hypothetical protein [Bdellovibrio sp. BCCA]|uniref:hypothetical protein n=1 Tax=Bdellovibrio sp. BCCA TaxID=3136281 RepID=UPI0030F026DC